MSTLANDFEILIGDAVYVPQLERIRQNIAVAKLLPSERARLDEIMALQFRLLERNVRRAELAV